MTTTMEKQKLELWFLHGKRAANDNMALEKNISQLNAKLQQLERDANDIRTQLATSTHRLAKAKETLNKYPAKEVMDKISGLIQQLSKEEVEVERERLMKEIKELVPPSVGPSRSPPSTATLPLKKRAKIMLPIQEFLDSKKTRMTTAPPPFNVDAHLAKILQMNNRRALLYTPFGQYLKDRHKSYLEEKKLEPGIEFYQAFASTPACTKDAQTFLFSLEDGSYKGIVRFPENDTYLDCPLKKATWTLYDSQGNVLKKVPVPYLESAAVTI